MFVYEWNIEGNEVLCTERWLEVEVAHTLENMSLETVSNVKRQSAVGEENRMLM